MKKFLAAISILVLALFLLTACDGNSKNPSASGNGGEEPTKRRLSFRDPDEELFAPDIIVNPGDVVFENDTVTIVYTKTTIDETSVDVRFDVTNHTDEDFYTTTCDPGINGKYADVGGVGVNTVRAGETSQDRIILYNDSLAKKGISAEDIETVQITIYGRKSGSNTDEIFEVIAVFNVK